MTAFGWIGWDGGWDGKDAILICPQRVSKVGPAHTRTNMEPETYCLNKEFVESAIFSLLRLELICLFTGDGIRVSLALKCMWPSNHFSHIRT